jgi:hypothetical protein
MHFDGIVGNMVLQSKKNGKNEDFYQNLLLRYEALEGLTELNKNFQIVLISCYSESLTLSFLDFFKTNNIDFDGVYCMIPD